MTGGPRRVNAKCFLGEHDWSTWSDQRRLSGPSFRVCKRCAKRETKGALT